MRTFYKFRDKVFHFDRLEEILKVYKDDLDSQESFLRISFNYPMMMESLHSHDAVSRICKGLPNGLR